MNQGKKMLENFCYNIECSVLFAWFYIYLLVLLNLR